MLGKIEDQKYKNWVAQNNQNRENSSYLHRAADIGASFIANPIITTGNWFEGKGPIYGQSSYLRGNMAGHPEDQAYARRMTNASSYPLDDYFNMVNPFNYYANTAVNLGAGDYTGAALNAAAVVPIFGGFSPKGGFQSLSTKTLGLGPKGYRAFENSAVGHAMHKTFEAPILRSAVKPNTVGNTLLQSGESNLQKTLLDVNAGQIFGGLSTASLPGAVYNYAQDPTAYNAVTGLLYAAGSPQVLQGLNAAKTFAQETPNLIKTIGQEAKVVGQFPKTASNIISGEAPLSTSSFARNNLVTIGDEGAQVIIPRTVGSSASENVAIQRAKIAEKMDSGVPLTEYEKSVVTAADKSLVTAEQFERGLTSGQFKDMGLSDETINDIRIILQRPNDYQTLSIWKENPELQALLRDPRLIDPTKFLIEGNAGTSTGTYLTSGAEGAATGSQVKEAIEQSLISSRAAFNEGQEATKAANATFKKGVKLSKKQGEHDKHEHPMTNEEMQQLQEFLKTMSNQPVKMYQDGGITGLPITYVDQPNVYSSGNTRSFTPASAQALNMLNNQIAYEGHLTDDKIAELKRNGFVIEDIDLHLPKNQNQHKPFQLHPYGFVAGNNDGPVNNVIFGGGLNAQFDTPLKQLAAGINIGATNVLGFDNDRVLYNQFGFNRPTFNLNYNIPYKKR